MSYSSTPKNTAGVRPDATYRTTGYEIGSLFDFKEVTDQEGL